MPFRHFIFIFFCIIYVDILHSQQDCHDAILVKNDTLLSFTSVIGYGKIKEIKGKSLGDSIYFPNEEASLWFKISPQKEGILRFYITPQYINDDWDFILFYSRNGKCENLIPVRSNISGKIKGKIHITGLDSNAKHHFIPSGPNPNFSAPIHVSPSQTYFLVINNYSKSGYGCSIQFNFTYQNQTKLEDPFVSVADTQINMNNEPRFIRIQTFDKKNRKKLPALITIQSPKEKLNQITSDLDFSVDEENLPVRIFIFVEGYMPYYHISEKPENLKIYLDPIEPGAKLSIEHIEFYGNSAKYKEDSKDYLDMIASWMSQNPDVKILIEGHVNGPDSKNTKDYRKLSKERAESVKNYLIEKNIDESRIKTVGLGNTRMIYPNPRNELQSRANRRVEIKVIK